MGIIRYSLKVQLRVLWQKMHTAFTPASPGDRKKYSVSVCAIFKNEAPFLAEWIEYHRLIGFDHFYLYDNGSTDSPENVLKPYIEDGFVTLTDWKGGQMQLAAYRHFMETWKDETCWVAFIDLDEFICPIKCRDIKSFLEPFRKCPAVFLHWKLFGNGGKLTHDFSKPVIEQYTYASSVLSPYGKSIVNTEYDIAEYEDVTLHIPVLKHNGSSSLYYPVDVFGHCVTSIRRNGKLLERKGRRMTSAAAAQVNHYRNMAWDIVCKKSERTDAVFSSAPRKHFSDFIRYEDTIDSADYNIYRFLMEYKLRVNGSDPRED